jgi:hypothetical protein
MNYAVYLEILYYICLCNLFAGMSTRFCVCFLMMLLLLLPFQVESVAVMSVDLGSEWMKIAIVSVISVSTRNSIQFCSHRSTSSKSKRAEYDLCLPKPN